jgi:glutamine synthetase
LPEILLDNTDRNRTSPFAFTGNKFEFRAVGSSANCSHAMMVLNTIVANQLTSFKKEVDALINKNVNKDEAILKVLREYIVASKRILFEGNGYSDEWVKEAKKRGLSNITTTPLALDAMVSKESLKLFEATGIFSHREAEARHEILLEDYIKKMEIESRVIEDLAINHIIPAAIKYQTQLAENVEAMHDIGLKANNTKVQMDMIKGISAGLMTIKTNIDGMVAERNKANNITTARAKAIAYCDKVKKYFDAIRDAADNMEAVVSDELWPLPKYREMLHIR